MQIKESPDKKQIVFKFENGSIFYDLPSKVSVASFKNKNNLLCYIGYENI